MAKELTPREQSERITKGIDKPHFIGPKSKEVRKQELVSHVQNYRETFTQEQQKRWREKLEELTNALLSYRN